MITILSTVISILGFRFRRRASQELELIGLRHQVSVPQQQHPDRIRCFSMDRILWVCLYRVWPQVLNAMVLVKPATVVQWHRKGLRIYWRRHRKSHASSACTPDNRGLPLGHCARLSAAGSGCVIWWDLPRSRRGDGHQRGRYRTTIALPEPLRRAHHWLDPSRMFGSHHHLLRASLAARPVELFSISSPYQNPSVPRQGLSAASPHPASLCRQDYRLPGGGRSASSRRASRRLISEVCEPTRWFLGEGSLHFPPAVLTRNGAQNFHSFCTDRRRPRRRDRTMNSEFSRDCQ